MASVMTPEQMRDFLAELLEGAAGGTREHWLRAIGPVEALMPVHLNIRGNWRVSPTASKRDRAAIDRAVALVQAEHPYVLA